MDRFLVPQFIEVEPKIIGPVTVRQFIIMIAAMILIFIEYKLLTFLTFAGVGLVTLIMGGVIAFVKVNGQPFHYFLLNIMQTARRPRLRVWHKDYTLKDVRAYFLTSEREVNPNELIPHKRLVTSSHLEELSLIVNTGGVYQPGEHEPVLYEEAPKQKI
ncbi:PrgI family protein [Candidatus Falkowbacteria bacterium]|nr:PrgI family protein [Candidatus Falkowbacteria bacterium]